MRPPSSASTRDRLLFHIKTRGPQTAAALAKRLGVTPMGVRQQLQRLAEEGLVEFDEERAGVGRPSRVWHLTAAGNGRFPEGYAELSLELIEAVRLAFGADGLARLVGERTELQRARYAARLPGRDAPLERRVAALAKLRREEGYLAEWRRAADGTYLLIENHCPVCAAASVCQGICGGELDLFRSALGPAQVERQEHMLDGARRCVYRIDAG